MSGQVNNGASEMKCDSLDDVGNGKHSGDGFVEISKTFSTKDALVVGTGSFDRVLYNE